MAEYKEESEGAPEWERYQIILTGKDPDSVQLDESYEDDAEIESDYTIPLHESGGVRQWDQITEEYKED